MATSLDRLSDETFDLLCSPCKRKQLNKEADKYCVDCSDYYCSLCVKFHEDIPALSGHKILDKGQFQHGISQALPMVPTERCEKHNHKPVDMYCQNHDDVGCSTCIAVEHRLCHDIFYIPEYLKNNADVPDSRDVLNTLAAAEDNATQQLDKFQLEKGRITKSRRLVFEKIENTAEELKKRIDELKQNTLKKTRDVYTPVEEMTDQNISLLQSMKSSIYSAKDKVNTSGNNITQVFVSIKKGQNVAAKARKRIDECNASYQTVDIDFEKDEMLLRLLNEMTDLGKVTQYDVKKTQSASDSKKIEKDSITLLQVKDKKKYSVRISSDSASCYIISVCALEDGTIILADSNNKKLKRVDSSTYIITDYCDLYCDIWQVCAVNKQEVAVSCLGAGVKFVSLHPKMNITTQLKPGFTIILGLTYTNGYMYVSDTKSVYKCRTGEKFQKLTMHQSGQTYFDNIYSLAVSGDGNKIYVADRIKGFVSMDTTGKVIESFNGPEVRSTEDVSVTDTGSVLVCGYGSANIVQFGPNCEMIGEVLKSAGEVSGCTSVCYNSVSSKLIVGLYNTDEIEVYELI